MIYPCSCETVHFSNKKKNKEILFKPGVSTKQIQLNCFMHNKIQAIIDNRRSENMLRFSLRKDLLPHPEANPYIIEELFSAGHLYMPTFPLSNSYNDGNSQSFIVRFDCIEYDYDKKMYQPCSDCHSIIILSVV